MATSQCEPSVCIVLYDLVEPLRLHRRGHEESPLLCRVAVAADWDDPTKAHAIQPVRLNEDLHCYTVGPAEPNNYVNETMGKNGTYFKTPITGTISFAFIPDGQVDLMFEMTPQPPGGESIVTISNESACTVRNGPIYNDEINCTKRLTINNPTRGTTYVLHAKGYNSTAHPPQKNDQTRVYDKTFTPFIVGPCGGSGQACCQGRPSAPNEAPCTGGLTCTNNLCGVMVGPPDLKVMSATFNWLLDEYGRNSYNHYEVLFSVQNQGTGPAPALSPSTARAT